MTAADVAVVGGGPAGAACAIVLATLGVETVLVHAPRPAHAWPGEALPPGAEALVDAVLGAGFLVDPPHRVAYGVRGAWGSSSPVSNDFIDHPLGSGWHLDRAAFDAQARERAAELGVRVVDALVAGLARIDGGWELACGTRAQQARWIVDATGRAGAIVGRLGIRRERHDAQLAEICLMRSRDEARVTTIESVDDGWWYSTPLADGRRVVAFLTDADLLGNASAAEFRRRLEGTRHIAPLVTGVPDRPARFPADTSVRERLWGSGWAAVGDAAVTWDPLSSQGITCAVLMGARAAQAITAVLDDRGDPALASWERDYRMLLQEHDELRCFYADAEARWPESRFWCRRRPQRHG